MVKVKSLWKTVNRCTSQRMRVKVVFSLHTISSLGEMKVEIVVFDGKVTKEQCTPEVSEWQYVHVLIK